MGEWISEVWHSREILYFLAWRDVKVRYKQAALGVAWAVLQPLFTMIIFTFFFGRLARIPSDGVPYPLFSYSALVLWTYFSVQRLRRSATAWSTNSSLITKIYFPRVLLPAAAAFGGLLDLIVSSVFLVGHADLLPRHAALDRAADPHLRRCRRCCWCSALACCSRR